MTDKWNSIPPITEKTGQKGVRVPLAQAILDPRTVINPIERTPLPPPPNQLPSGRTIKIRNR